jgi:hypothetical protein
VLEVYFGDEVDDVVLENLQEGLSVEIARGQEGMAAAAEAAQQEGVLEAGRLPYVANTGRRGGGVEGSTTAIEICGPISPWSRMMNRLRTRAALRRCREISTPHSSWPGLSRPSTLLGHQYFRRLSRLGQARWQEGGKPFAFLIFDSVDGRDKPGYNGVD